MCQQEQLREHTGVHGILNIHSAQKLVYNTLPGLTNCLLSNLTVQDHASCLGRGLSKIRGQGMPAPKKFPIQGALPHMGAMHRSALLQSLLNLWPLPGPQGQQANASGKQICPGSKCKAEFPCFTVGCFALIYLFGLKLDQDRRPPFFACKIHRGQGQQISTSSG
eukprot:847389-Pelagomonas_calceolata.AAC.1